MKPSQAVQQIANILSAINHHLKEYEVPKSKTVDEYWKKIHPYALKLDSHDEYVRYVQNSLNEALHLYEQVSKEKLEELSRKTIEKKRSMQKQLPLLQTYDDLLEKLHKLEQLQRLITQQEFKANDTSLDGDVRDSAKAILAQKLSEFKTLARQTLGRGVKDKPELSREEWSKKVLFIVAKHVDNFRAQYRRDYGKDPSITLQREYESLIPKLQKDFEHYEQALDGTTVLGDHLTNLLSYDQKIYRGSLDEKEQRKQMLHLKRDLEAALESAQNLVTLLRS